jgi:hypothetical protein
MELLNRSADNIGYRKEWLSKPMVNFLARGVLYFNLKASFLCKFTAGKYAHFVWDAGALYVYTDSDPTGFPLIRHKLKAGFTVYSKDLERALVERTHIEVGFGYEVRETERLHEGHQFYEVVIGRKYINPSKLK